MWNKSPNFETNHSLRRLHFVVFVYALHCSVKPTWTSYLQLLSVWNSFQYENNE